MFQFFKFLLGLGISSIAIYYWMQFGQTVPTKALPPLFKFGFRLLPHLDYLVTVLGAYLFLSGALNSYRRLILYLNRPNRRRDEDD
ncbi:MAG: hypothetical protein HYU97_02070 [Deltaproteobacteria bacterium]|nr:hypothetical protein [Deltaproteobacteria bacterium]